MKGYTNTDNIQVQLGRTLTDEQAVYCNELIIPAAENWVDQNSSRVYGEQPVVAEQLVFTSPYTWLAKAPVSELTAVRGYFYGYQPTDMFTINPSSYMLVDPTQGYLWLPDWTAYQYVEVDYIPDPTIPDRIKLATTMVACTFIRTVLHPETEWMSDYASGQDIRLKFRELKVPDMVYTLLDSSGGGIVVA